MEFNYKRLKAERIAKGFTVEEMGESLGVTKGTYSKKENGKTAITVEEFSLLFKKLRINPAEINIFFYPKCCRNGNNAE